VRRGLLLALALSTSLVLCGCTPDLRSAATEAITERVAEFQEQLRTAGAQSADDFIEKIEEGEIDRLDSSLLRELPEKSGPNHEAYSGVYLAQAAGDEVELRITISSEQRTSDVTGGHVALLYVCYSTTYPRFEVEAAECPSNLIQALYSDSRWQPAPEAMER
jgi:hypothetical protein